MHQQTGCLTGKRSIPAPYGTLHRWLEVLDFVLDRRRDERLKMRGIKRSVYHRTQAFAKEVIFAGEQTEDGVLRGFGTLRDVFGGGAKVAALGENLNRRFQDSG